MVRSAVPAGRKLDPVRTLESPMTATPVELAAEPRPQVASCATCGLPLEGRYCTACGEERLEPHQLTVRHFVTDSLVPEIVNLDGKIWRTLGLLLFRPGALALEYVAGRRRKYVQPLRVLLTAIVVFVLAMPKGVGFTFKIGPIALSVMPASMPKTGSVQGTLAQIDRFHVLERQFTAKAGPVTTASDEVTRRFSALLDGFATPVSFMSVLLLALVLYEMFRRRRPLLVEHAVLSMHYFSFVLLSSLVYVIARKVDFFGSMTSFLVFMLLVSLWQAAYLVFALRRFYWPADARRLIPWTRATGAAVLLYVANSAFITGVQLVGGMIAIWRL
jgi:hypothetical protein